MEYTISPAYGKDYRTRKLALQAFHEGKEFLNQTLGVKGKYCSIRDFKPGDVIRLRYNHLREVAIHRIVGTVK